MGRLLLLADDASACDGSWAPALPACAAQRRPVPCLPRSCGTISATCCACARSAQRTSPTRQVAAASCPLPLARLPAGNPYMHGRCSRCVQARVCAVLCVLLCILCALQAAVPSCHRRLMRFEHLPHSICGCGCACAQPPSHAPLCASRACRQYLQRPATQSRFCFVCHACRRAWSCGCCTPRPGA